ncbi:DUF3365 domain-containing protein [Sulfurimonas sp.]|nr:DUF3365 domain-containing protein [Sulfurimonas sp.]
MDRENSFHALVVSIFVALGFLFFYMYERMHEEHSYRLKQSEQYLFYEAKALFESMVNTRTWSSAYGGVYVKQKDGLEPNKYLKDNILHAKDNTKLVKINPAWMTRQISELATKKSDKHYRITSINPINPENSPDIFEREALDYFEKNTKEDYFNNITSMYNFMGKLTVKESCMSCHAQQGYKVGEVRGGIRISLPLNRHNEAIRKEISNYNYDKSLFLTAVLIIYFLMFFSYYIIAKSQLKLKNEVAKNKVKDNLLIAQSRNAAMGEMISMIAHQWRQPLSTIAMDVESINIDLQLGEIETETLGSNLVEIRGQVDYLSKTIDDFRNFFRQNKEKELIKVSHVIDECIEITKTSLEVHGISYKVNNLDEELELNIFSRELLQVLLILINNSRDSLIENSVDNPLVKIELLQDNDNTIINVFDNGVGIPDDIVSKIFEPYFTTKIQKDGTGLGLYMSKMIIASNFNGKIEAKNLDKGVCFTLSFSNKA